eukprot:4885696-Prymnesium_polylepis.1
MAEACAGLGCKSSAYAALADGTRTPGGTASFFSHVACPYCSCRASDWPNRNSCPPLAVAVREICSDWADCVNGMLSLAPVALDRRHVLGFSARLCGHFTHDPHCFFQPLSTYCNEGPPQLITDVNDHKRVALMDGAGVVITWPQATAEQLKAACSALLPAGSKQHVQCTVPLFAWRRVAQSVLRPQPEIVAAVQGRYLISVPWTNRSAYGAVHIPSGNKQACGYASLLWTVMARDGEVSTPDVFIATEDASIVTEFRACVVAREWHIFWFGNESLCHTVMAVEEPVNHCLIRHWADLTMLVRADWAVVSFDTSFGRLVQVLRTAPPESLSSFGTRPDLVNPMAAPAWKGIKCMQAWDCERS